MLQYCVSMLYSRAVLRPDLIHNNVIIAGLEEPGFHLLSFNIDISNQCCKVAKLGKALEKKKNLFD